MLLLPTFHFACEATDFLALSRSDARLSGKAKAPCSVNSLRNFWIEVSEMPNSRATRSINCHYSGPAAQLLASTRR
jgi:hypothetical protein